MTHDPNACDTYLMGNKAPRRPRDPAQLAKLIADIATGEIEDALSVQKKNDNLRGRAGGRKGGKVRAKKLTPAQRSEIARIAASARWKKGNS